MSQRKLAPGLHRETLAVSAAVDASQYGENSEALYLSSSFTQPDSETAARRFAGEEEGYIYSRFTNPTVAGMEQRLAALSQTDVAQWCTAIVPETRLLLAKRRPTRSPTCATSRRWPTSRTTRARCWPWTTAFAPRRCSSRHGSAPTS